MWTARMDVTPFIDACGVTATGSMFSATFAAATADDDDEEDDDDVAPCEGMSNAVEEDDDEAVDKEIHCPP